MNAASAATGGAAALLLGAGAALLAIADGVPKIDPWGPDRGRMLEALAVCGAAFLYVGGDAGEEWLPDPQYARWHDLWAEALTNRPWFRERAVVAMFKLGFNCSEDLARTVAGDAKVQTPDVRYNFGVSQDALHRISPAQWADLCWIPSSFAGVFHIAANLMQQELAHLVLQEPSGTLGARVQGNCEHWASTRLRHSIYPPRGSCTEHTDYGVITLQQSNGPGLQAHIGGEWRSLHPPKGYVLVFAGDMMQRLTNGRVPALKHRVCLEAEGRTLVQGGAHQAVRQSHIMFLQPDKHTVVQPLRQYLRGDGTDLPPVRYGDWHGAKASLAFSRSA